MFPAQVWQREKRSIVPCRGSIKPPSFGFPPSIVSEYFTPPSVVTDICFISSGLSTPNCTSFTSRKGAGDPDAKAISLLQQDGRSDEVIAETFSLSSKRFSLLERPQFLSDGRSSVNSLNSFVLVQQLVTFSHVFHEGFKR